MSTSPICNTSDESCRSCHGPKWSQRPECLGNCMFHRCLKELIDNQHRSHSLPAKSHADAGSCKWCLFGLPETSWPQSQDSRLPWWQVDVTGLLGTWFPVNDKLELKLIPFDYNIVFDMKKTWWMNWQTRYAWKGALSAAPQPENAVLICHFQFWSRWVSQARPKWALARCNQTSAQEKVEKTLLKWDGASSAGRGTLVFGNFLQSCRLMAHQEPMKKHISCSRISTLTSCGFNAVLNLSPQLDDGFLHTRPAILVVALTIQKASLNYV